MRSCLKRPTAETAAMLDREMLYTYLVVSGWAGQPQIPQFAHIDAIAPWLHGYMAPSGACASALH
jgi:hypothetical protein